MLRKTKPGAAKHCKYPSLYATTGVTGTSGIDEAICISINKLEIPLDKIKRNPERDTGIEPVP